MFHQPLRALARLALPALGVLALTGTALAQVPRPQVRNGASRGVNANTSNDASRLELKRFDIKSVTGTRIAVELGTFSQNRRMQSEVIIYFVDGAQRHQLWRGTPTFAQTQGGFSSAATVDVRGRAVQRGDLEAVVVDCKNNPKCKRTIRLNTGDLVLSGQPEFRTGGRNRTLTLMVKNTGPSPARNCKAQFKVGNRVVAEQAVNALRINEDQPVRFDYPNGDQNKDATVHLDCGDLVPNNNARRLRLR